MDEIPNGSHVIFQLLGKGQRFPDQTGHLLSERTVESLNVTGFARFLAHSSMSLARQWHWVGRPEIGIADRTLAIDPRH